MTTKVRKAVIPAAGLGTRFLPVTKAVPKEMLPIVDKPVIQYVVEEAVAAGIEQVVIVTSPEKRAIEDHFDRQLELETYLGARHRWDDLALVRKPTELARFAFVRQDEPRGNGHAVLCAHAVVGNEPFALVWGDDLVDARVPCLRQLLDVYERYGGAVAGVTRVATEDIPRYGIVDAEQLDERVYRIRAIVEKPSVEVAPSNLATAHAWVLPPRIFALLADTVPGKDGEIWLADAIGHLLDEQPVFAVEFEGNHYDVGDRSEYLKATVDFALRRSDVGPGLRHHLRGVVAGEDDDPAVPR